MLLFILPIYCQLNSYVDNRLGEIMEKSKKKMTMEEFKKWTETPVEYDRDKWWYMDQEFWKRRRKIDKYVKLPLEEFMRVMEDESIE